MATVQHFEDISDRYNVNAIYSYIEMTDSSQTNNDDNDGDYRLIKKHTPWLLVRKRTILTERQQLVGEVSTNFCG
jgi:hypothetical protein